MMPNWLLSQRARFATWVPILLLILLIPLSQTSFASVEYNAELTDESGNKSENTGIKKYYIEYVIEVVPSENYGENKSDYFGGEIQQKNSYEILEPADRKLKSAADDLDDEIGMISFLTIILVVFCIINTKQKLQVHKFVNYETVKGTLLLLIGIYSILAFFSITGGLSDYSEKLNSEYKFLGPEIDFDDGIWGGFEYEFELDGLGEIKVSREWGPSFMLLALIPCVALSIIGSIANFSYLRESLEIDDLDVYFGYENYFSRAVNIIPMALVGLLIISIIGSMIMPWHNIEQTWEMEKRDEQWILGETDGWEIINKTSNTAYVSWGMNPFYVDFSNDTSLSTYENFDGGESSSIDSFSEHPELSKSSKPVLELRWPLICTLIIGLFFFANRYIERISNYLSGETNGWTILILLCILLLHSFGGIGNYDESFSEEIDNDIRFLSPSVELYSTNMSAQSSLSGTSLLEGEIETYFDSNGATLTFNRGLVSYFVLTEWNPGTGYYLSDLVPILTLTLLALILLPKFFSQLNQYEEGFSFEFDKEIWIARPTVIALCGVLLTSFLGTGLGELVIDSKSSVPQRLQRWDLSWDENYDEDSETVILSDGEEIVREYAPNELGMLYRTRINGYCDEGSSSPTVDGVDKIIWEIGVPEGVNTSNLGVLQGEIECNLQDGFSIRWDNQVSIESNYAPSEEEFLDGVSFPENGEGTWVLKIRAETNGGVSEFDSDPDLEVFYFANFRGMENLTAVAV